MTLKKYLTRTKEFFRDIFNLNKRQTPLSNLSRKYQKETLKFYNEILRGLEKLYFNVYGQNMKLSPLTPLRTSYDDLFNEDIRKEFNVHGDGTRLILKRKTLEDIF
jgi:hypothetical protein